MASLINLLEIKFLGFFLVLFQESKISFGIYNVEKSLTRIGWAVIIFLLLALVFGLIRLTTKILKKPKLK
jgi:hypothetical protein